MRALTPCAVAVILLSAPALSPSFRTGAPIGQADARQAGIDLVLARAKAYAVEYVRSLSSVVCEERYEQSLTRPRIRDLGAASQMLDGGTKLSRNEAVLESRALVSDLLLVQVPGVPGWLSFRDVYSVDGRAIRDREDRLVKLFIEPNPDRIAQAERIRNESSRYNIGSAVRDINVPTFALQFLLPDAVGHFAFQDGGNDRVDEHVTRVVVYREASRPTFIRNQRDEDVPASGRYWIEPETGAVLRTRLETRSDVKEMRIDVEYRVEPKLGIRVPVRMEEAHDLRSGSVEEKLTGIARYTNFRQFRVDTSERIR